MNITRAEIRSSRASIIRSSRKWLGSSRSGRHNGRIYHDDFYVTGQHGFLGCIGRSTGIATVFLKDPFSITYFEEVTSGFLGCFDADPRLESCYDKRELYRQQILAATIFHNVHLDSTASPFAVSFKLGEFPCLVPVLWLLCQTSRSATFSTFRACQQVFLPTIQLCKASGLEACRIRQHGTCI